MKHLLFATLFILLSSCTYAQKNKKIKKKPEIKKAIVPVSKCFITYKVRWNELRIYGEATVVEEQQIICASYQYTQVNLVLLLFDNTKLYIDKSVVISIDKIETIKN